MNERNPVLAIILFVLMTPFGLVHAADVQGPAQEEGEIAGAAFRIDIPENWNGGLLMYSHGYALRGTEPGFNMQVVEAAHRLRMAVAQSRYTGQGWAAREGILDTEALRRYFTAKYGQTNPTVIAGHSQGAVITYATIEEFPDVYDGALPMCGAGTTALHFFEDRVFNTRLLFDYYFPGLPGSVVEFPDGQQTYAKVNQKARELIEAEPEKAEMFARMVQISSPDAIPGVVAFWSEILREMIERTGGNAFDNRDTIYDGSPDDAKLNREISRYTADPEAVEYLREWVSLTGEIADPVLALHTIVDDLIPPVYANMYDDKVTVLGLDDLYVQAFVTSVGHCNFNVDEMEAALRQLTDWIETGERAPGGDLTKR